MGFLLHGDFAQQRADDSADGVVRRKLEKEDCGSKKSGGSEEFGAPAGFTES